MGGFPTYNGMSREEMLKEMILLGRDMGINIHFVEISEEKVEKKSCFKKLIDRVLRKK